MSATKEILALSFLKGDNLLCLTTREEDEEFIRNYEILNADDCPTIPGLTIMGMLDSSGLIQEGTSTCVKAASMEICKGRKVDLFHINSVDLERTIRAFQDAFRNYRNEDTYLLRAIPV